VSTELNAMKALHTGLFYLLQDMGVEFTAVVGLSASEPCGLFLAGALQQQPDLQEATNACAELYQRLEGTGNMLIVFDVSQSQVLEAIAEVGGSTAALGAWFGSAAGAITGSTQDMEAVRLLAEKKGWKHMVPRTGFGDRIPFHCPSLFAQHQQDLDLFRRIRFSKPHLPYFSSYTGSRLLDSDTIHGDFLFQSMAETARSFDAIRACIRAGHRQFVELNLKPLYVRTVEEALEVEGVLDLDDDEPVKVYCCGPSKAEMQAVAKKLLAG